MHALLPLAPPQLSQPIGVSADALDAGVVWVNANQILWPDTPFGGWKASGFGFEQGAEGMAPFLRRKSVVVAPSPGGGDGYVGVW